MQTVRLDSQHIAPSKVICIGRNYVAHIEELGNELPADMVVFCKPNSAIGEILHAEHGGEPLHYEGEIALMVEQGQFAAAGFGLDLTKRALQSALKSKGLPWERAKAFDGAALFSDFHRIDHLVDLTLELSVDNAPRQAGDVGLMLYPPDQILTELCAFMSLEDGDIVMTGTPAGVGPVHAGERFQGRVLQGGNLLAEQEWQVQ